MIQHKGDYQFYSTVAMDINKYYNTEGKPANADTLSLSIFNLNRI